MCVFIHITEVFVKYILALTGNNGMNQTGKGGVLRKGRANPKGCGPLVIPSVISDALKTLIGMIV